MAGLKYDNGKKYKNCQTKKLDIFLYGHIWSGHYFLKLLLFNYYHCKLYSKQNRQ